MSTREKDFCIRAKYISHNQANGWYCWKDKTKKTLDIITSWCYNDINNINHAGAPATKKREEKKMNNLPKRETNASLFAHVIDLIASNSRYGKIAEIIDYTQINREESELTSYEFDMVAKVQWGGSEGIYLACYLEGDFDQSDRKHLKAGTIKTLQTSEEAFCLMGELSGLITYFGRKYVNDNRKLFS